MGVSLTRTKDLEDTVGIYEQFTAKKSFAKNKRNVLVVDDDLHLQGLIVAIVSRKGWLPTSASDGVEALSKFREAADNFDLVLTDFNMPKMDGLKLAKNIKLIRPSVSIILLTGSSSVDIENNDNLTFTDDVIFKPFTIKKLYQTLDVIEMGSFQNPQESSFQRERNNEPRPDFLKQI